MLYIPHVCTNKFSICTITAERLCLFGLAKVGGGIDELHARPDRRCCAETPTDGAATLPAAWIVPSETRTENTQISPTAPGLRHAVFSLLFDGV